MICMIRRIIAKSRVNRVDIDPQAVALNGVYVCVSVCVVVSRQN